jgi:hypothetical protein
MNLLKIFLNENTFLFIGQGNFMGCFKDPSPGKDLNLASLSTNTLIASKCFDFCLSRNFTYAGIQNRYIK